MEPNSYRTDRRTRRRYLLLAAGVILLVAIAGAAAWNYTALEEYADTDTVVAWLRHIRSSPWLIPAVLLAYVVASATLFPNTVLSVATVLSLGGVKGIALAMGGSMLATVVFYAVGRRFGAAPLRHAESPGLDRITKAFRAGGIPAIVSVRLLPLAPFSVVNVAAGAAKVKIWPYTVGSFIGLLPGPLLVGLFGRQVRKLLTEPGPMSGIVLAATIAAGLLGLLWTRRLARAQESDSASSTRRQDCHWHSTGRISGRPRQRPVFGLGNLFRRSVGGCK